MAITVAFYDLFLHNLGRGVHRFQDHHATVALFTRSYVPDLEMDYDYVDMRTNIELPGSSTVGGYVQGGLAMPYSDFAYFSDLNASLLGSQAVIWPHLTGTFRYGVIYDNKGAFDTPLIGLIDFGADQVFNNSECKLSFPSGVFQIAR